MAFLIPVLIPFVPYVTSIFIELFGSSSLVTAIFKVKKVIERRNLLKTFKKRSEILRLHKNIEANSRWLNDLKTNSVALILFKLIGTAFAAPFAVSFSLTKKFFLLFNLSLSEREKLEMALSKRGRL